MKRNPAELRAHVYRDRAERKWWIDIDDPTLNQTEEEALGGTWTGFARSWAEAMQLAYKMLRDIDRLLMDQVHASRASRRAQRCTECHEVVPEGKGCTECDEVVPEVETKREMTSPMYVFRGGVYLLDEHAGVLIDSVGNFSAKTKGNPRSLAVLLKAIAEAIEDDVEAVPVEGEKP